MAISLILTEAEVRVFGGGFTVIMPQNGAIVAYCDTRREAEDLCSLFRSLGPLCRPRNYPSNDVDESCPSG